MPSFLVEGYLPDSPADAHTHARLAAESAEGVHHVRTIVLPTDEMVLHLFEAPSDEAVRRAAAHVDLRYERIVEAVDGLSKPTEAKS